MPSKPRSPYELCVPTDSPLWNMVCKAAGCIGNVYIDVATGEVTLEDGSELVMFSQYLRMPDD